MKTCQVCKYQIMEDSVSICPNCGAPLAESQGPSDSLTSDETNFENAQYSSGGPDQADVFEDNIEICDPGAFIGAEQTDDEKTSEIDISGIVEDEIVKEEPQEPVADEDTTQRLRRLSPEQAAEIRDSLMMADDSDQQASLADASRLLGNPPQPESEFASKTGPGEGEETSLPESPQDNKKNASNAPADDPPQLPPDAQDQNSPLLNEIGVIKPSPGNIRRIAYFHNKFIQLTGNYQPSSGEELIIGNNNYILKPKKIKQQYAIAAFSLVLALILFAVGSQFISPTLPGQGSIIGVVLDETGRPLISGVKVSVPEAGRAAISNGLGFFQIDDVPTGTYLIKLTTPDGWVITDNISVVGEELTITTLGNDWSQAQLINAQPEKQPEPVQNHAAANTNTTQYQNSSRSTTTQTSSTAKKETQPKEKKSKYSALNLKTNVTNPRIMASGEVLGQGNLIYKKLAPGRHQVMVSADGYKSWQGKVDLKADETYTLNVTLESVTTASAPKNNKSGSNTDKPADPPQYTANDYYEEGSTRYENGDYGTAVSSFTEAIKLKPSMGDAYRERGRSYALLEQNEKAASDFVRAGEIYISQSRLQEAKDLFNKALESNDESIPALLNLAYLTRDQHGLNEAVDIYKQVLDIDKKNFAANFELSKTYFSLGKYKDADKYLRKTQKIDSSVPEVYHYLMLTQFARNDFDKVKDTYGDYTDIASEDEIMAFKDNPKFEAIMRILKHK